MMQFTIIYESKDEQVRLVSVKATSPQLYLFYPETGMLKYKPDAFDLWRSKA